jgi:hypothetical protein
MAATSAGRTCSAANHRAGNQQDRSAGPLDQGQHRRGPLAQHQVAFPMTRHRPAGRLGGPLADRDGVQELAAAMGPGACPVGSAWPDRCADNAAGRGAAPNGAGRTGSGRWSRRRRAWSGSRGTPPEASPLAAPVTSTLSAWPPPPHGAAAQPPAWPAWVAMAARSGGRCCMPPACNAEARIEGPRLPIRRAISRSDSPCRQRRQSSSCPWTDSPQDRTHHLHRRHTRHCGSDATTH